MRNIKWQPFTEVNDGGPSSSWPTHNLLKDWYLRSLSEKVRASLTRLSSDHRRNRWMSWRRSFCHQSPIKSNPLIFPLKFTWTKYRWLRRLYRQKLLFFGIIDTTRTTIKNRFLIIDPSFSEFCSQLGHEQLFMPSSSFTKYFNNNMSQN